MLKNNFRCGISLLLYMSSISNTLASETFNYNYCAPPLNGCPGQTETECYKKILSILSPRSDEKNIAITVQMTNFDDSSLSSAILSNKPSLITYATNTTNFYTTAYQPIMNEFLDKGYPYSGFMALNFSSTNYSSFHRKITTVLKMIPGSSQNTYKLDQISGSYNFTKASRCKNFEGLYVYTISSSEQGSPAYNKIKDIFKESILTEYPNLNKRQLVLNKIAQTNIGISDFTTYSSECDFYKSYSILNEINKELCREQ